MSNVSQWSTTAASNNLTPPDGWPENQAPSTVNDSARENMAAIAKWYSDLDGTLTSGGSGGAYTLTTNQVHAALADQSMLVFRANHASPSGHTLNVDSLGAKTMIGPAIAADQIVVAVYNATDDTYEHISNSRDVVQSETVVDATNGGANDLTEIDFTGLLAGANMIIVELERISLSGADDILIQLGDSGGIETTGYESVSGLISASSQSTIASTSGIVHRESNAASTIVAHIILTRFTGNTWVASHAGSNVSGSVSVGSGVKTLSAELDRLRVAQDGASTFDNGNVNVKVIR